MNNSFFLFGFACLQLLLGSAALAMDTQFEYACLGIDGIPISNGSVLESSCCFKGQLILGAPANCRAGFNSIGASAAAGAAFGINLAQKTLDTAKGMSGATVAYGTPTPSEHGSGPSSGASTNAITSSGSGSGDGGSGSGNDSLGANGNSGAGSGSGPRGAGGAGGSGGGGSGGLGTSGSTGASKKSESGDEAAGPNAAGGYVKAGGAGGEGDKNALAGLNFGNLFGKDGAGGKGNGDGLTEINFDGEGAESAKDAAAELSGSTTDPSDYFNRIDKTASLFKIVSNRYTKETIKKHVGAAENKLEKGAH